MIVIEFAGIDGDDRESAEIVFEGEDAAEVVVAAAAAPAAAAQS